MAEKIVNITDKNKSESDTKKQLCTYADVLKLRAEYVIGMADQIEDIAREQAKLANIPFKKCYADFNINPAFPTDLTNNEIGMITYIYSDENADYYIQMIPMLNMEEVSSDVSCVTIKEENGKTYLLHNENGVSSWDEKEEPDEDDSLPEMTEKQKEMYFSNNPESDILKEFLYTADDTSDEAYENFRERNKILCKFYERICDCLSPILITDMKTGNMNLYLIPADDFRAGIRIGQRKDELVMQQYLSDCDFAPYDIDEWNEEGDCDDLEEDFAEYCKEIFRTKDINKLETICYSMAGRFTKCGICSVPLSKEAYASVPMSNPGKAFIYISGESALIDGKKRQPTDEEKENLSCFLNALMRIMPK